MSFYRGDSDAGGVTTGDMNAAIGAAVAAIPAGGSDGTFALRKLGLSSGQALSKAFADGLYAAAGSGGGGGTVDLSPYALKRDAASVTDLPPISVPCGSTSTAARSVFVFIAPFPCKLRYLSIVAASPTVGTGTSNSDTTGGQWEVQAIKVVPAGYHVKRDVLVAKKNGNRESKTDTGELVIANIPWDLDPLLFEQTDPATGLAVSPPPPYVFQKGDHLRVDFVPFGPTPGNWGANALLTARVEPYDKASNEAWT